jgi:hypothetical protein
MKTTTKRDVHGAQDAISVFRYIAGKREQSGRAGVLKDFLFKELILHIDKMDSHELDRMSVLLKAATAAVERQQDRKLYTVHAWNGRGPGVDLDNIIRSPHSGWTDHRSKMKRRPHKGNNFQSGNTIYRGEPYSIDADDMRALLALEEEGWTVTIDGDSSYYPGRTLNIQVWKEEEQPCPINENSGA